MSDVLKGLAQLKQARGEEVKEQGGAEPVVLEVPTGARGRDKTLAGRVPLALHIRFAKLLLDVASEQDVARVYTDEALEAALLLLLDDKAAQDIWRQKLVEVRQSRRGR